MAHGEKMLICWWLEYLQDKSFKKLKFQLAKNVDDQQYEDTWQSLWRDNVYAQEGRVENETVGWLDYICTWQNEIFNRLCGYQKLRLYLLHEFIFAATLHDTEIQTSLDNMQRRNIYSWVERVEPSISDPKDVFILMEQWQKILQSKRSL